MFIRSVTGASHSYRPSRIRDDGDDACTPFQQYDRNAVQSRSVSAMLRLMRLKGFLSSDHRNCERLRNVFSSDPEDLHDAKTQELILTLDAHGRKSAELHSASIFPDIFGPLFDSDIKQYFNGKRFRGQWTKQRQIPTCGTLLEKQSNKNATETAKLSKNPRKALTDRRHTVTKLMTSLTLAEHSAIASGDYEGVENARKRWTTLHSARHLMSPYSDAYRGTDSYVRHAKKSQILAALNLDKLQEDRGAVEADTPAINRGTGRKSVSLFYDYSFSPYASVLVDMMNYV